MSLSALTFRQKTTKRTSQLFLVLFVMLVIHSLTRPQSMNPPTVFEVEFPDFQIVPSSQREITIPSLSVSQIFLHILKPAADNIDYGAIATSVNGQTAAAISEVVSGARGKVVKINLRIRSGYQFVNGRNTVEVWAENRRGRKYYASFVIKTVNQNWNEDFTYEVQQAPGGMKEAPPQIVLLEPKRAVQFTAKTKSMTVRISGLASSGNVIAHVSIDGQKLPLKAEEKTGTRELARLDLENSVAFETTRRINPNTTRIVVEAEDRLGSRTRVTVPVLARNYETVRAGQKYALLIGISKYRNNGVPDLQYADKDARSIYEFLQQPSAGGFSRANMLLLTNEQATFARIREALTSFVANASPDDLLLIFFAGHGAPDYFAPQNLYLIAHDTDVLRMPETGFSMPVLRGYLDQNIKSRRVVLLMDACHSGGLSPAGTRDLGNNLANQYLERLLYQEQGRAIITSSDVNERSHESHKWGSGHGVFTYYLLEGLKGNADANSDRFVTVGELFRYVRQKVRLDTRLQQNPRMLAGDNEHLALSVAHVARNRKRNTPKRK